MLTAKQEIITRLLIASGYPKTTKLTTSQVQEKILEYAEVAEMILCYAKEDDYQEMFKQFLKYQDEQNRIMVMIKDTLESLQSIAIYDGDKDDYDCF